MYAETVRDAEIFNYPMTSDLSHRAQQSVPAGDTDAGTLRCALRDMTLGYLKKSATPIGYRLSAIGYRLSAIG